MTDSLMLVAAAFVLDLLVGDPRRMPHPVRAMGWLAARFESLLRPAPLPLRISGAVAVVGVVGLSGAAAWVLVAGASALHPVAGKVVSVLLMYSCFATRDLADHARSVLGPLMAGDLPLARDRVSWMVGRDTGSLDAEGVALAATESVAENTVDGVTGPLFFAMLFGPVGAVVYKAASTLDSSFGYRNERYLEFGWASARFDDLMNLLPARLTVPAIAVAALALKLRFFDIFSAVRLGARLHESPNAGYPEAAFAGALGVRFGGVRSYGGVEKRAPELGFDPAACTPEALRQAVALMRTTAAVFLAAGVLISSGLAMIR